MTRARSGAGRVAVAMLVALSAWSASCAAKPDAATKRATAKLQDLLRDQAKQAGKELVAGEEPGALGTTVVRVVVKDAYPGSGVARVVVWNGKSYGVHGERDLADLARERGWLKKAPETAGFVKLVGDAQFEGLLAVDESTAPSLSAGKDGLVLSLVRRTFPSGAREPVRVTIGAKGPAQVSVGGGAAPTAEKSPAANPLADAQRALESGSAVEKSAAINALAKSSDPAAKALLARATLLPAEQLAIDALQAIGSTPEAAAALRKAWSGLDAARRATLVQNATELHGPAFGALLKP